LKQLENIDAERVFRCPIARDPTCKAMSKYICEGLVEFLRRTEFTSRTSNGTFGTTRSATDGCDR
jgi:hypothetical protein